MTLRILFTLAIVLIISTNAKTQDPGTEVYLLTSSPGTESYSMYGHSALRVVDRSANLDIVYNWGIFDFNTPNFNYVFARGRLNYMLAICSNNSFIQEYFLEDRSVFSQKVNMSENDIIKLKLFLNENMLEENRYYRYDFFMDNCATRIRDIFETIYGERLIYPDEPDSGHPTFRERLDEYRADMVWLDMGEDLLLGSSADKECGFRESMFLPDYLMSNLSQAQISVDGGTEPLLSETEAIFEFALPHRETRIYMQPWFQISILALLILFFSFRIRKRWIHNVFDMGFFIIMFVLSFLMIFTNYLTEHDAMGNNFNLVWLNPLLLVTPFILLLKRSFDIIWRTHIALSIVFMILIIIIPQAINPGYIPVIIILIIRSYYRLATVKLL